jgi:hypothetical protein
VVTAITLASTRSCNTLTEGKKERAWLGLALVFSSDEMCKLCAQVLGLIYLATHCVEIANGACSLY